MKTWTRNSPLWIWVVLPALLFVLAWEPIGITPLLFVSFVPFLVLHDRLKSGPLWRYWGLLYLSILGWNLSTTWWVYYASSVGAVSMVILNTLFMCLPFLILRKIQKNRAYNFVIFAVFTLLWVLYEYGHHRWDLSWPWLALGNGFSATPILIQWYEFTGTLGGTIWVLWANIGVFLGIRFGYKRVGLYLIAWVGVPVLVSVLWFFSVNIEKGEPIKVAVLQPSFNPWNEKFTRNPLDMQAEMQNLSLAAIDSNTNWLLWPETSLVRSLDLGYIDRDPQVIMVQQELLSRYPKLQLLTGFHGIQYYNGAGKPTRTARKSAYDDRIFYDVYNSALCLSREQGIGYYHKSKLVPGTEQMPFIHTIPFLESLAISLDENSISGSLGISDSAISLGTDQPVAPIICYESIYGDYVRGYITRGATWLGIITNDAWWENTPGHKQHHSYARLRAIELRKWVARSANTGISGFIDPRGSDYDNSTWYAKTCLQRTIYANSDKTVYLAIGDRGVLLVYGLLLLVFGLTLRFFRR